MSQASQKDLHQLDVVCRKFLRAVVGPPSNIDWSRPWHEILHDWNGKVQSVTLEHGMKLWSHRSLASYWKLAIHFASVPHDRWIQRILRWMQTFSFRAVFANGRMANTGTRYGTLATPHGGLHSFLQTMRMIYIVSLRSCTYEVGFRRSPAPKWAAHGHAGLID